MVCTVSCVSARGLCLVALSLVCGGMSDDFGIVM
jgi:hypothetical protein